MVTMEMKAAGRWMYVKASGFIDDWDDPPDIGEVVNEAKGLDLEAILYDGRGLTGELGAKKAATNLYVLSQQLYGVRTAFVLPKGLLPPFKLGERIAKSMGTSVRYFLSMDEASQWLESGDDGSGRPKRADRRVDSLMCG